MEGGREGGKEGEREGRTYLKADFHPIKLGGLEKLGRLERAEKTLLGLGLGREGGKEGGREGGRVGK